MATDKRLDQVSQLTDFDYALLVKGDQVGKMTKQQVAEAIGNLLYGATTKETLASVVAGLIPMKRFIKSSANNASSISINVLNVDWSDVLPKKWALFAGGWSNRNIWYAEGICRVYSTGGNNYNSANVGFHDEGITPSVSIGNDGVLSVDIGFNASYVNLFVFY